ncbi:LytR family transcriptional attenuator [Anaerobacterium chartisolvens]|uniref:LytR family transcriptional attenuator n=1 Tax=Anaerobacterium chartisolvens TaxID=1297424 RepID=A0A369B5S6_9FIRM|nr:LCP family protein [Anaerobacterium chartisolvens]RCX16843.1 LytR family transcriptional attenuator [Anaerobacterium chartisolvens]
MNARKFYFTLSFSILTFLFISGMLILAYIGSTASAEAFPGGNILGDFFVRKDPVNVLVLGGDKVNKNTDTIMVVNYNPSTSLINVLSIPRDTMVNINGRSRKINYAYPHGGIEQAVKTISNLLNISINYYVYIDTSVFREVIDLLGGIDYNVPVNMKYDDPTQNLHINLKKGQQRLYGKDAEGFMRFRKPNSYKSSDAEFKQYYDGSDLKRIDAQQSFVKEVIRQKANISYLPKLNSIINTVFDKLETNVSINDALRLSNNITSVKPDAVTTFKLLGEDRMSGGAWYYVYNGKIINNSTKDTFNAEDVLEEYFKAAGEFSNTVNTGSKAAFSEEAASGSTSKINTKKNPSNVQSSIKTQSKTKP